VRRFIIAFFIVFTLVLMVFYFRNKSVNGAEAGTAAPQTISPESNSSIEVDLNAALNNSDTALVSLIPLVPGERLFQTQGVDFNGDGYDDQINAIHREGQPNIIILIGIYDPGQNVYVRAEEIDTGIANEQSFSFSCMDIIGEHRNSLVYSGLTANADYLMQVFLGSGNAANFRLGLIGNFRTNGTFFIQQVDRYDAYESSNISGTSYPIWVYSSNTASPNSLDQIQTMFDWDVRMGRYVQVRQTRVAGQRSAAAEIARIQDGTVDTLAAYLEGIWVQNTPADSLDRSVFIDYNAREIVFMSGGIQEIYTWSRSVLRRNGIYISMVNASIANLQRQFDVSLTGVNEIIVRVQDDVHMNITENSLWDGAYRKLAQISELSGTKGLAAVEGILADLTGGQTWTASDGAKIRFDGYTYGADNGVLSGTGGLDTGRFSLFPLDGIVVIQFRPESAARYFDPAYIITGGTESTGRPYFTLEPVTLRLTGWVKTEKPVLRLDPAGI
jgi:hypothetical protein